MRIKMIQTNHFNWIEFTVELGKENTMMPPGFNLLFEKGFLISEVVLLAKESSHTAIIVFERANRDALYAHPTNAEPSLLESLLQAFGFPSLCCHLLGLPAALNIRVVHRDDCVFLLSLLSLI